MLDNKILSVCLEPAAAEAVEKAKAAKISAKAPSNTAIDCLFISGVVRTN